MNAKLFFKTVFLIIIAVVLVMIGLYNKETVTFRLPPVLPQAVRQPAAIMFIGFFALGVLSGTILTAGKSSRDSGGSSKPSKSSK